VSSRGNGLDMPTCARVLDIGTFTFLLLAYFIRWVIFASPLNKDRLQKFTTKICILSYLYYTFIEYFLSFWGRTLCPVSNHMGSIWRNWLIRKSMEARTEITCRYLSSNLQHTAGWHCFNLKPGVDRF
jgi:hypothetical protein